jgi:hypothetical protein
MTTSPKSIYRLVSAGYDAKSMSTKAFLDLNRPRYLVGRHVVPWFAESLKVKRRSSMRSLIFAICLFGFSFAYSQVVHFERQMGQFEVPKGYRYGFEDGRRTLSLVPAAPHHVEIRFTLNSKKEYAAQRPTIGKDFVRDAAGKKGKQLFDIPGNGGVAFLDYSESRQAGSDQIRSTHGMMGLNNANVTFTITAEEKDTDSSTMKEIFSRGLIELLGRVKSRGV